MGADLKDCLTSAVSIADKATVLLVSFSNGKSFKIFKSFF
jgi:hypothetical protein